MTLFILFKLFIFGWLDFGLSKRWWTNCQYLHPAPSRFTITNRVQFRALSLSPSHFIYGNPEPQGQGLKMVHQVSSLHIVLVSSEGVPLQDYSNYWSLDKSSISPWTHTISKLGCLHVLRICRYKYVYVYYDLERYCIGIVYSITMLISSGQVGKVARLLCLP